MNDSEPLQFLSQKLFLNNYTELDKDEKSIVDKFFHTTGLFTDCLEKEVEYWKLSEYEKELFNKNLLLEKQTILYLGILIDYFEIVQNGIHNKKYNHNHYPVIANDLMNAFLDYEKSMRNFFIAKENFLSAS